MPQNKNLSTAWQRMLGDDWEVVKDRYLHTLGNLTLTGYNSELGDRPFAEKKDLLEEAERLLKTINMWDKREESPTLLSYGEQRMLEMLLAYASKPDIILLDEPSAGLPTAEVGAFTQTLRKLNGDTTMLFVAHDMDLVFSLADSIIVLYFGQIIAHVTPEDIANNPKVQEIYLGSGEDDTYDANVNDIIDKNKNEEGE